MMVCVIQNGDTIRFLKCELGCRLSREPPQSRRPDGLNHLRFGKLNVFFLHSRVLYVASYPGSVQLHFFVLSGQFVTKYSQF